MGWLGSLFGGLFDTANSAANRKAQREENEKQREHARQQQEDAQSFNAEQAQLDRDFQSSEAQINRDFQSKMAEDAYDREVEFYEQYQSIGAQIRQYKDAGLNPALLAGGVSPASSAPVSASPSGSLPSGASASSGASVAGVSSLPEVIGFAEKALDLESLKTQIEDYKASIREKNSRSLLNEIDALTRGNMNEATLSQIVASVDASRADTSVKIDSLKTALLNRQLLEATINTEGERASNLYALTQKYINEAEKVAQEVSEKRESWNYRLMETKANAIIADFESSFADIDDNLELGEWGDTFIKFVRMLILSKD